MAGYYFALPPVTALTTAQQAALNETEQIALSGGPGTGKSVVSMWRHITNYEQGRRSLLLTYTTTLKRYLEACCRGTSVTAAQQVGTSFRNMYLAHTRRYSEVIVDEAQDLSPDYFTGICSPVSYGADDSQILYPEHCTRQCQLEEIFPGNVPCVLDQNFRSTRAIMQCVRQAFPNAAISSTMINNIREIGIRPSLIIGNWSDRDDMPAAELQTIIQIIQELGDAEQNIAILLPWKTTVQKYANALHGKINDYSFYYEDSGVFPDGCPPLKNVHVTTFKSAKGLEFDAVIIPDFHKMNSIIGRYHIDWQDYYVGCTRAKSNLFLFSNRNLPLLSGVVEIKTI